MKTLTVTLSNETAQKLAEHAAENGKSVEAWASQVVEDAYESDWFDDLPAEDRAAIEEGIAQADRGETIPHAQVFADLNRKHGW